MDVETLRRDLEANSGMPGLEILRPDEVDAAVRIFYRDGFVVVRDVLTPDQVRFLRRGGEREAEALVAMVPNRDDIRGRNRYSWGGASLESVPSRLTASVAVNGYGGVTELSLTFP